MAWKRDTSAVVSTGDTIYVNAETGYKVHGRSVGTAAAAGGSTTAREFVVYEGTTKIRPHRTLKDAQKDADTRAVMFPPKKPVEQPAAPAVKPTPSQVRVINSFNGTPVESGRTNARSYEVCVKRGWIVKHEAWPFYLTTQAGADAVGVPLGEHWVERSPGQSLARIRFTGRPMVATQEEIDNAHGLAQIISPGWKGPFMTETVKTVETLPADVKPAYATPGSDEYWLLLVRSEHDIRRLQVPQLRAYAKAMNVGPFRSGTTRKQMVDTLVSAYGDMANKPALAPVFVEAQPEETSTAPAVSRGEFPLDAADIKPGDIIRIGTNGAKHAGGALVTRRMAIKVTESVWTPKGRLAVSGESLSVNDLHPIGGYNGAHIVGRDGGMWEMVEQADNAPAPTPEPAPAPSLDNVEITPELAYKAALWQCRQAGIPEKVLRVSRDHAQMIGYEAETSYIMNVMLADVEYYK